MNGGWIDQNGYTPYIKLYTDPSSTEGYTLSRIPDVLQLNREMTEIGSVDQLEAGDQAGRGQWPHDPAVDEPRDKRKAGAKRDTGSVCAIALGTLPKNMQPT